MTELMGVDTSTPEGVLANLIRRGGRSAYIDPAQLQSLPHQPLQDAEFGVPLPAPGKVIGAPANYYEHVDEMPDAQTIMDWGAFLKAPSSVIGPRGVVQLPYTDKRTDYEAELAVVIGSTTRNVSADRALDQVFGYTCLLDITVRSTEDRSTRKSFDTFTPLGPWITTVDEIGDPGRLDLKCWVNAALRQHSSTSKLIYGVHELIAYISSVMTLHPGDVIATGTPAGVGPIVAGDVIAVEINGLGRLEVDVRADYAIPYADRPGKRR
ncbi:fumarylacetoacetate hydrolase family protein [Nocardia sp. NPDC052278]|uniref:fumarylacetoacetate hydrolase family protein n=1 Tax=unclassified Nocardia TaxID=2637762 RepID=UPI0036C04102